MKSIITSETIFLMSDEVVSQGYRLYLILLPIKAISYCFA